MKLTHDQTVCFLIPWQHNPLLYRGQITDPSSCINIKIIYIKHKQKYRTSTQRMFVLFKFRIACALRKSYENYYFKLTGLLSKYFLRKGNSWRSVKQALCAVKLTMFPETAPPTLITSYPSL